MPIPKYQTIMLPLLKLTATHGELNRCEAVELLANEFKLTDAERKELLPSGEQTVIANRAGWARTYLKKAGLLDAPQRGIATITERGRKVLSENPSSINLEYLRKFPEFSTFISVSNQKNELSPNINEDTWTPEEILENAFLKLKKNVLSEMLEKIKSCTPKFFEEMVVDTLVKIGYGGSRKDAGRAIGQSGDEGIDGIINEDRLGLDVIYLQAKRWKDIVGRPEIQKFVGALHGKRAKKGIFITTSDFSENAKEFVNNIETKVILISGQQLVLISKKLVF